MCMCVSKADGWTSVPFQMCPPLWSCDCTGNPRATSWAQFLTASPVRWLVRFFYMESVSCSIGSSERLKEKVKKQMWVENYGSLSQKWVWFLWNGCAVPLVRKDSYRERRQSINSISFLTVSSLSSQVGQTHWPTVRLHTLPVLTCKVEE